MRPARPGRPFIATILLILLIAPFARAAEPLTLDAVLAEATSSNPDLAAAREKVRVAELAKKAATAPFLPSVTGAASYDRSGGDINGVGTVSASDSYGLSLTAKQSLFAGGTDAATFHRREAELAAAQADLDAARATLSFNVKSSFARLLFAQNQLELTQSIEKRREENVRLVDLQYQAGQENKGSLLRSKANEHEATFEVSQAERALRVAHIDLLRTMGRSEFETIEATGTLGAVEPNGIPDFRGLLPQVPAVRTAAAGVEAAKTDVSFARGDFFPSLDASGTTGRSGDTWPPKDDHWDAGVSLSLPIFEGGRGAYSLKSARAALRQSSDQSKSVTDQTALDLETSYAALADAAERAEVDQEFLDAATVRAEIARSQYTSGLLSFNDWDLIENDLISAQKSNLSALRDAAIAEADWERNQGKGAVQ